MRTCDASKGWYFGGWIQDNNGVQPKGFNFDGATGNPGGACVVNCSNEYSIYSFHTGGANMLFGDGSVRTVGDKITWGVFAPLGTRNRGDVPSDY